MSCKPQDGDALENGDNLSAEVGALTAGGGSGLFRCEVGGLAALSRQSGVSGRMGDHLRGCHLIAPFKAAIGRVQVGVEAIAGGGRGDDTRSAVAGRVAGMD